MKTVVYILLASDTWVINWTHYLFSWYSIIFARRFVDAEQISQGKNQFSLFFHYFASQMFFQSAV